jgi:hypothetical protein
MVVVPSLIPFPGKLDLDGNIATKRKKFKRLWDNYEIASRLSGKDTKLHRGGGGEMSASVLASISGSLSLSSAVSSASMSS